MEASKLKELVDKKYTIKQMAAEMGCSQTNIRYWLKKHNLKQVRGPGGKHPKDYKTPRKCCKCGETDPDKFYGNKTTTCGKCHNQIQIKKGQENKEFAVQYLGGKCAHCGLVAHSCVYDLHHNDPSEKDIAFNTWRYWSRDKIKKELDKCTLLCACCHRLEHQRLREEGS